jgi:hypothetical protein
LPRKKLREGYPRLQLKVVVRDLEEDFATIRKVYEALGKGMRMAVDANHMAPKLRTAGYAFPKASGSASSPTERSGAPGYVIRIKESRI